MKERLTKKGIPFAQIANEFLNDKTLSLKAKGLFAYLYSKPEDWDFSMFRIKNDCTDGKASVRIGLKELENAGYLLRTKQSDGRMHYHLTYQPCSENRNEPDSEKAKFRKSQVAKIGTISNKDNISNKELITNKDDALKEKLKDFENEIEKAIYPKVPQGIEAEEIKKFFLYWTEPNKSRTKLRWEMEKTWETKRRLGTWFNNAIKFGSKNTGMWKCDYGHMHKKGEECGHALERMYQQTSPYAKQLKEKFKTNQ
jgi:hypothetical protein